MSRSRAILCSACRGLISNEERACPYCGAALPGLGGTSSALDRFFTDLDVVFLTRAGCVALYGAQAIGTYALDPERLTAPRRLLDLGGISPLVSHLMGSAERLALLDGELWRLLTASWLHGSALHLAMNMWFVAPGLRQALIIFGPARTLVIWLLSGVGGMAVGAAFAPAGVVGSSTSIFGLMGALAVFGWRRGGTLGRALRDHVLQQILWVVLLSMGISNVSHAGHVGGLLTGALVAAALPAHESAPERRGPRLLALVLLILTVLAFGVAGVQALRFAPVQG
ncbi:MAG: rhomboid family intramembrane serine protease [Deltaproteobacteria bacterium]|nr:rhomboid family intramembrane serine protease [Deltaproteobacteria bacterium]